MSSTFQWGMVFGPWPRGQFRYLEPGFTSLLLFWCSGFYTIHPPCPAHSSNHTQSEMGTLPTQRLTCCRLAVGQNTGRDCWELVAWVWSSQGYPHLLPLQPQFAGLSGTASSALAASWKKFKAEFTICGIYKQPFIPLPRLEQYLHARKLHAAVPASDLAPGSPASCPNACLVLLAWLGACCCAVSMAANSQRGWLAPTSPNAKGERWEELLRIVPFPSFFFLFPSMVTLTKIVFEVHAGYLPAMGLEEIKIVRVRQRKYNFSKCWPPCV